MDFVDINSQGMRDRSMRSGTELAREIKLTDWSTAGNLSNRSSGVQIPRDICTRLKRYLYSTKCSWIIKADMILVQVIFLTVLLRVELVEKAGRMKLEICTYQHSLAEVLGEGQVISLFPTVATRSLKMFGIREASLTILLRFFSVDVKFH